MEQVSTIRSPATRTFSWRERARSLLTTAEVAAYCDVSESRVLYWIEAGVLQARPVGEARYSVIFADLWAFLERWCLLGGTRSFVGKAVLAAEPGPC